MNAAGLRLSPPIEWPAALLAGVVASVVYTAALVGYVSLPGSEVSVSGPLWRAGGVWTLLNLGSIGVPIALWLRYRLRSPLVLLGLILLFWHVFPLLRIGSEGDSPGFTFVFAFAPLYVVAYCLLAAGEYWLR